MSEPSAIGLGHDLHAFIVAASNLQGELRGRLSTMEDFWRSKDEAWRNANANSYYEVRMNAIEDFLDSLMEAKRFADDFIIEETLASAGRRQ